MRSDRTDKQQIFSRLELLGEDTSKFVSGDITIEYYYNDSEKRELDFVNGFGDLRIACNDTIMSFYLETYDEEARQDSIAKLGKLINFLTDYKAAMEYTSEVVGATEKEIEAKRKTGELVLDAAPIEG